MAPRNIETRVESLEQRVTRLEELPIRMDALRLVVPGIGVGLLLAVAWVRLADPAWYPLGGVEPLVYALAAATSFTVALVAGVPSARRAAAVQPMMAMRAE